MRTFDKKNKLTFNLFGLVVVLSIIILAFIVLQVMNVEKEVYHVAKNSTIYDEEMNQIEVTSSGTIEKKWNGNYYLSLEDGEKYNLGEHNVVYDGSKNSMHIIGSGYQVFTDGSVQKLADSTEVNNLSEIMFFKLDDRNYLMNGVRIMDEAEGFSTKNYLQIDIDKSGNALLVNDEVNMKTIEPMVLANGDVRFDIANEKLIYQDQVVDLKAINGSTNEYQPEVEENAEEETNRDSSVINNSETNENNQVFQYGTGGGGNGFTNNASNNGNSSSSGNNQSGTNNNAGQSDNNNNQPIYDRTIAVRSIESSVTSVKVNYMISDVENKFLDVHLLLRDSDGNEQKFALNKSLQSAEIRGLHPNTKYNVSLNYSMYVNEKGESVKYDYVADEIDVRTKGISASLSVDKITETKLYFTVKLDKRFPVDKATLEVKNADDEYLEGTLIEVNVEKAISSEGWSSSIKIDNTITRYLLQLINVEYEGEPINVNAKVISVNEKNDDLVSRLLKFFSW